MLTGESVFLRPVEPSDATVLMLWENDPKNWRVTDTEVPFSLHGIMQLIEQQQHIRSTGQLRFMICLKEDGHAIGTIDLYDADFKNRRAAVGILIGEVNERGKGSATEALELLVEYAREVLDLHNVYCSVQADNSASLKLFEKAGFDRVGSRKEWFFLKGEWLDEISFQLCLKK